MKQLLAKKTLLGQAIFFLSFEKKITTQEAVETLHSHGLQLLELPDQSHRMVERVQEFYQCKRPLIFAQDKYAFPLCRIGVSSESPNPCWSEECIFVCVKLNL